MEFVKKCLYRYTQSFGRMGALEGIFSATEEQVAKMKGKELYLGEVLGKHSEVYGAINDETLELLTQDQEFIAQAEVYGLIPSGIDILERFEDWLTDNPEEAEDSEG